MDRETERRRVLRAVQQLPDSERRVTTLFYLSGYSQSEIADFLDIPVSTVKNRLRKARKLPKDWMLTMVEDTLHDHAPSRDDRFERRVLRSTLPLQVGWIGLDGDKDPAGSNEHKLGATTIGRAEADVPECRVWYVEPRSDLPGGEWETVLEEVAARKIPGLSGGFELTGELLGRVGKLEHLIYLDLSLCETISDAGLKQLSNLTSLQYLCLSGCKLITDAGLEILRNMRGLRYLRLTECEQIGDSTMEYLAGLDDLALLILSGTAVTDAGLEHLRGKPRLTHLHLSPHITDAGIEILRYLPAFVDPNGDHPMWKIDVYRSPTPTHLHTVGDGITSKGIRTISQLKGLFGVELRMNEWNRDGLTHLALLPNLKRLSLNGGEHVGDEQLNAIGKLSDLESLEIGRAVAGDEGFSALAGCHSLRQLVAYALKNVTGKGVAALTVLPNLEYLYLGGKQLDDKSLKSLPDFQALREFWTGNGNGFTDEAFAHISGVPNLESLTNMYCKATGDRATEHVVKAKKLKSYCIWGTEITDSSLRLLSGMKTLENLLLWNCPNVTNGGLDHLATLTNLRSLDLQECPRLTAECLNPFDSAVRINFQPTK